MKSASIVTIGDEILIGQVLDTNSRELARSLEELGIRVGRMLSVSDNTQDIAATLEQELAVHDIVITTGGLGPTRDDITKSVLATLTGSRQMVSHPAQLRKVREILQDRGLDVLPVNIAQADVPETAEVIVNERGTAPIMIFRNVRGGGTLYSLPGVPHEAIGAIPAILEDIRKHQEISPILHRNIMVYGIAESELSERIASWEDALPQEMHLAYLPHPLTGIRLRLSCYGGNPEKNSRQMAERLSALKAMLGELVYADGDSSLERELGALLRQHKRTLSVAESCTGGKIAQLITSVAGSSAYFLGSVTSYAISVKQKVLGVPADTIHKHGVVSSEVAAAMAQGVRKLTGSDYSVATTGLAGPGGDASHPVGTVWIGVATPRATYTVKYLFPYDRERNIERFSAAALNFLRLKLIFELTY